MQEDLNEIYKQANKYNIQFNAMNVQLYHSLSSTNWTSEYTGPESNMIQNLESVSQLKVYMNNDSRLAMIHHGER